LEPSPEYSTLRKGCEGIELADSITGDGHKLLNVVSAFRTLFLHFTCINLTIKNKPYDCGFFFTRSPQIPFSVFQNANAAYLSTRPNNSQQVVIPSALNIGIENSRRFRALPVYSTLIAYGREGHRDMFKRQIQLAREVALFLSQHADFELLSVREADGVADEMIRSVYIIVLFRARDESLNGELVDRINSTRRMYVSGTSWQGQPACRIAVSSWKVNVKGDGELIRKVFDEVMQAWKNKAMPSS
jgi:glutamate/tyrosine decarboxylase-like PLP-dependent enzyme